MDAIKSSEIDVTLAMFTAESKVIRDRVITFGPKQKAAETRIHLSERVCENRDHSEEQCSSLGCCIWDPRDPAGEQCFGSSKEECTYESIAALTTGRSCSPVYVYRKYTPCKKLI